MNTFDATADRLACATARVVDVLASSPVDSLSDEQIARLLSDSAEVRNAVDLVIAATAAVIDQRSNRDRGQDGMARKNGHRTATSFVQNITGQSKSEVTRALHTGADLLDGPDGLPAPGVEGGMDAGVEGGVDGGAVGGVDAGSDGAAGAAGAGPARWRMLLREALTEGRVSTAQHHAIRTGLGEPPVDRYPDLDPQFLVGAWARAASILLDEADDLPVEELRAAARTARDRLDPVGVSLRFDARYQARSLRRWTDENGQQHAHITLDDESAAWVDAILVKARRVKIGPRFVGEDADKKNADAAADQRTLEQVQYDHVLAVLRTGAKADPSQAFGDNQPGVRIVVESDAITVDDEGTLRVTGVGHLQDGGTALPGSVIEKYLCDAGTMPVLMDGMKRPLDLGREKRLFTRKQRTAGAIRDGGCLGVHCDAPASQTEMHHTDHWWEHHGSTDIDDGVPLCTSCHLQLHRSGARILRIRDPITGTDTYWMHYTPDPDTGTTPPPRRLRSRSPRRFEAA